MDNNVTSSFLTPDDITAYSTVILVLVTAIYVFFSARLTRETVKLREVETEPFISIHLKSFHSGGRLKLIIKNIGKGPAYNLSFKMDEKFNELFQYNFKNKISYFPPELELISIAEYSDKFFKLDIEYILINMKYYSKENKLIENDFKLEWNYLDKTLIGTDTFEGIKKNLEDVSKEIKDLNKIIKDKKYEVSHKLRILELEKNDMYIQFIFSNGYIGKILRKDISRLRLGDIDKIHTENGDIYDYSTDTYIKAEEIFYLIKKINGVKS